MSVASHRFTRPPPTPADRTLEARIDRLTNSLPPQDAALLQTQFRAVEATVERARQASRDAQQNVRVALTAPTFDPDAAAQALGALREARDRRLADVLRGGDAVALADLLEVPPGLPGEADGRRVHAVHARA